MGEGTTVQGPSLNELEQYKTDDEYMTELASEDEGASDPDKERLEEEMDVAVGAQLARQLASLCGTDADIPEMSVPEDSLSPEMRAIKRKTKRKPHPKLNSPYFDGMGGKLNAQAAVASEEGQKELEKRYANELAPSFNPKPNAPSA